MIFIANSADFSANNLGQISIYTIEDVSQSTLDFLGHYSKDFSDEQKIAVHQMLTNLGYGDNDSLFSKIETLMLPFLSATVDEAFLNAKDWSDMSLNSTTATKEDFRVNNSKLITNKDKPNIGLKSKVKIPNLSLGIFNTGTFESAGDGTSIIHSFIPSDNRYIIKYKSIYYNTNNICISINSSSILAVNYNDEKSFLKEPSSVEDIITDYNDYTLQFVRYNQGEGFSALFVSPSLTYTELFLLSVSIVTCMNKFVE